jgi:integrase
MTLYKRGATWWFNFEHTRDGVSKHYQKSAKTGDRNVALKRERHFRAKIENAEFGIKDVVQKDSDITLKKLFDALEADYRIRGILTSRNKSNLKMVRESFKDATRALSVTTAQIDAYIEKRIKAKYAPASTNRMTGMLGLAYKLAVDRGDIDKADVPHIRHLPEAGNERKGFFDETQFRALHDALPSDLADFALFGYLSSWRKNEIATLKWSDIEKDLIHLRAENAKDRRARSLVIAGELVGLLERRQEARLVGGSTFAGYVFHRDGKPIQEFRKSWASACKKAGLKGRLFHDLRRSGVRNMVRAGVPQSIAMAVSGHSTFSMFRRYNIVDAPDLKEAMLRVEKYNEEQRNKVVAIAQ